ncbi:MAG: DUF1848 family protein [Chitinivibrionales bacterium]|nr:DUF1848 family protein [Chitinivibrionales bacterium]
MPPSSPQYISASRRNDLPRFFFRDFFSALEKGEISYDGGYGKSYTVSLKPEHVLGYIFWSKNFGYFIEHPSFNDLLKHNNVIFHFTINDTPILESNIPPLHKRLEILKRLVDSVGPERVLWRYDPVCKYRDSSGKIRTNETPFYSIIKQVAKTGISRCYFSFMTLYKKVHSRGIVFEQFTSSEKENIAHIMLQAAAGEGMNLYNCCNEDILNLVPGIKQAHCVDNELLKSTDRFGVHKAPKKKPTRNGCGCYQSRDIGSYRPACAHGCLYCYANPQR